jgi:hypothetical protein
MRIVVLFVLLLALATFVGCGKHVIKKSNLVCGDEICDPSIGETVKTCPRDCAETTKGSGLPDPNRTIDAVNTFDEDLETVKQGE